MQAWREFSRGKRSKQDTARFELCLEDNIFALNQELSSGNWMPDPYEMFLVNDPKLRRIHKASVRDRVLYQAVFRVLYKIFDPGFIFHSYSSRDNKGTHAGVVAFEGYLRKTSANYTRSAHVVKCDIRKFFDSIDHDILYRLIKEKIKDEKLLLLLRKIVDSFSTASGKGLPLGNVTSQLFANIYMNELDQYIKRELRSECYIRYCDDFVIISESKQYLEECVRKIGEFCSDKLSLELHPKKVIFRKVYQGVDFLGYVSLPYRRVIRTRTKRRILRKLDEIKSLNDKGLADPEFMDRSAQSYLGILSHCEGKRIKDQIERTFYD